MNSLKIKILSLTVAIMGVAVILTAWHNLQTQSALLDRMALQNSMLLSETIRNSIIGEMSTGRSENVQAALEKIKREPSIESLNIFDESGRILVSAIPEETGDLVRPTDLIAFRSGRQFFSNTLEGEDCYAAIVPILNEPGCHRCHDPEQQVLGILNLHLDFLELANLQKKGRQATVVSSAVMLGVLVVALTWFILFYVDRPLKQLVAAMTRVEEGDFDRAHADISSSEEMASLAGKFNRMVERLRQLIDTTIGHERELAISQEKLAHTSEISSMNLALEDRLKEIEQLNVSLEERIEEIEEANYKIADLASDLETKNTGLEQAVERLSALYKMGLALNSTMNLDKLFDLLIRKTMEALKARIGYILLLEPETDTLRIAGTAGLPEALDPELRIPLKPGGVSHWVIAHRQPLLLQAMDRAREFSRVSRLGYTRETVVCAPLTIKDEIIGTISMANHQDLGSFTSEDLSLLTTIAAQASIAIKNARLYEEQQANYLSTVQALISAVEASDAYTRGHSERVTRYSLAIARTLGFAPAALKRLEQAAILHDVGKIGIDAALLHKQGRLSEADFQALRLHPEIGVRILEPIHFLREVRQIILQHHERFDGRGYPNSLSGEALLIEARILAVADTYDAMTSDRPYRKALPHATAIAEILDHSGSQFDPAVVTAFLSLWESDLPLGQQI
jgi:putative nucleotidyltransferase with HDIG domain